MGCATGAVELGLSGMMTDAGSFRRRLGGKGAPGGGKGGGRARWDGD